MKETNEAALVLALQPAVRYCSPGTARRWWGLAAGCSTPLGVSVPQLGEVAAPPSWVGVLVENVRLDLFFRPLLPVLGSPKCR